MSIEFIIAFLFFFGIGWFGMKRYFDKKKEHFEDRDN